MIVSTVFVEGQVRARHDDATRTVTTWDATGALIPSTPEAPNPRPYTAQENADADAASAAAQEAEAEAIRSAVDRAILDAIRHVSETVHADGEAWAQPTGAHDAYPSGITVTHGGKTWTSTIPANVWPPGVTGWVEVTEGTPAWVQPLGAHDAYALGARVTHGGQTWTSTVPANVWEPGVYGWSLA